MRTLALTLMTVALAAPAGADHLVGPDVSRARLEEARSVRSDDLARVDALLASPEAARVTAKLGVSPERARAGLATLTDAELRELSARAQALESDPSAGRIGGQRDIIIVVLVVLIVLLVLKAV